MPPTFLCFYLDIMSYLLNNVYIISYDANFVETF